MFVYSTFLVWKAMVKMPLMADLGTVFVPEHFPGPEPSGYNLNSRKILGMNSPWKNRSDPTQ